MPPAQTLRVIQPTSSTVTYTISTRSERKTFPGILRYYATILVRILVGLITVQLLWEKWRITFKPRPAVVQCVLPNGWEYMRIQLAERCPWRYLAPCAALVLFLVFRRGYIEESLTVLRGLGVQTSTSSSSYLQKPTTRFIPATSIQDILIHEAFKGFEIKFYLAIVVVDEESVFVVFPSLLPRRAILEDVWRGSRRCLWDHERKTESEKTNERQEMK